MIKPSLKRNKPNKDRASVCKQARIKKIGWGVLTIGFILISVLFAAIRSYVDYPLDHQIYWYETESATPMSACVITLKPVSNEDALSVLKSIHMTDTDTITAQGRATLGAMHDAQFYCNGSEPKRVALLAYRSNVYRHMSFIAFVNLVYSAIFAVASYFFCKKVLFPKLGQWIKKPRLKKAKT